MRIVWGKVMPGQWKAYETAFKQAMARRGDVKGMKGHWLARDSQDPDAGYSISLWDSEQNMREYWDSKQREEAMAPVRQFYVNQFTTTHCEVRYART